VKEIQPDATRILITAVLSLNTVIDSINKGEIYRFIVKPWLREELLATVKNAVQRYDLIRSHGRLHATTLAMNEKLTQLNQALEVQVAKVAEQNRQLQELARAHEENLRQSVELCVQTMQTFYPTLGNQARRVFELCKAMAKGLDLSPEHRQTLEISAWIHDIGLVGVPRQLIKRWEEAPAKLTEAERALVQHHPILGAELAISSIILKASPPPSAPTMKDSTAAAIPTGWPATTSVACRLLAVAVAYAESNYGPKPARK